MYRIGWFSTGRDKAARDLLETVQGSIRRGEIGAEIEFVFCNREPGESKQSDQFLKLVEDYHVPIVRFSYQKYKSARGVLNPKPGEPRPQWRLDYDREVMKRLGEFQPELSVLAGYMLINGEEMCQRYNMINLHPAAPGGPKGMWQEVIWQLIEERARETGVMMHLVTPELDMGPPVTYCTFSIRGKPFDDYWRKVEGRAIKEIQESEGKDNPLFKAIREHELAREFPLIVATIKAFSEGRVRITRDKEVVDVEGRPIRGYNLSSEIDEMVERRG
jgi:phosphoribosylglycinamide formyltransferase-1